MNRAASRTPSSDDAVLVARGVEQVDQVLGREVARGARRVRAAAGPAGRRSRSVRTPAAEPGRDVGQRRPARVVEVVRHAGRARCPPPSREPGQLGDLVRDADADRVAEADLVGAELEQPHGDLDRRAPDRRRPVYGQPNAVET